MSAPDGWVVGSRQRHEQHGGQDGVAHPAQQPPVLRSARTSAATRPPPGSPVGNPCAGTPSGRLRWVASGTTSSSTRSPASSREVLARHLDRPGLSVPDEPKAALSLTSCLALVGVLDQLARGGGQVLRATHSPLLAALPGATVLQLSERGVERVEWQELDLVDHWRRYLADPRASLRHVVG